MLTSSLSRIQFLLVALLVCASALSRTALLAAETASDQDKVRVLVVTGGHDFEAEPFLQVFKDNPRITFEAVAHPQAHARFKADATAKFDVLVLYDMWSNIGDGAKADLVNLLKQGKGLVALHHCLASYPNWDEYAKIIGGKFHLQKRVENGVEKPGSTYKHDVDFTVRIADKRHPVTRGLSDFTIHDETYGGFEVGPDSHTLLTTDEPTSSQVIGWAKTYAKARVVYLELGHDHQAYENPNFRRLVAQAIAWVAPKK